jgi:hypothetical protein
MLTFRPHSFRINAVLTVLAIALGTGCAAKPDVPLQDLAFSGEYGRAREYAAKNILVPKDKNQKTELSDREYILSRMRFALVAMSDGCVSDDPVFTEVYDRLSQQGINDANRGAARLINEDIQQWKGEPFEQALMLSYLSMYYAAQGSWDNARAAASSSQFRLKDFGSTKEGKRRTNADIVREAAIADQQRKDFFNNYQERQTDFCLGILLDAIANQQIGRQEEAESKFNAAAAIRPELRELTRELARGGYNDVLVVAWGAGPQKIGTGPDQAIASWKHLTRSTDERLLVTFAGGTQKAYPLVCDVNRMAEDHMWNSLEDMRKAKSLVGNVMLGVGAGVTAYGAQKRDTGTAVAGLGIALIGAGLKAGAHADTRYCDVMPQRYYVVPIKSGNTTTIDLEIEGHPASHLTLAEVKAPAQGKPTNLRYVNLVTRPNATTSQWASSGRIFYNSDFYPTQVAKPWPYILGGDCVRKPTSKALEYYQKNGYLTDMTVADLEDLYRQERIIFDGPAQLRTRHVLEGGKSLEAPLPGTAGFARLFCQQHPSYAPRSPNVALLANQIKSQAAPTAVSVAGQ